MRHPEEDVLIEYVLGDLTADRRQAVDEHVASCARCAEQLRQLQGALHVVASVPSLDFQERLRQRMHGLIEQESGKGVTAGRRAERRRRGRVQWRAGAALLAASLAIVAFGVTRRAVMPPADTLYYSSSAGRVFEGVPLYVDAPLEALSEIESHVASLPDVTLVLHIADEEAVLVTLVGPEQAVLDIAAALGLDSTTLHPDEDGAVRLELALYQLQGASSHDEFHFCIGINCDTGP